MTLHDAFEQRRAATSDINQHLVTLAKLAASCETVTEFGVRGGNSTVALLEGLSQKAVSDGRKGTLVSYDFAPSELNPVPYLPENVSWGFVLADTNLIPMIGHTDMLFIDTLHTATQVLSELRFAPLVRRYLVFHDTMSFGVLGQDGGPGLLVGILQFLGSSEGDQWKVFSHAQNNNGLLVLIHR
jgi:hypothetical protein